MIGAAEHGLRVLDPVPVGCEDDVRLLLARMPALSPGYWEPGPKVFVFLAERRRRDLAWCLAPEDNVREYGHLGDLFASALAREYGAARHWLWSAELAASGSHDSFWVRAAVVLAVRPCPLDEFLSEGTP